MPAYPATPAFRSLSVNIFLETLKKILESFRRKQIILDQYLSYHRKKAKMASVDNRIPVWLDCDPGHDVSSARVVQDGTGVTHESVATGCTRERDGKVEGASRVRSVTAAAKRVQALLVPPHLRSISGSVQVPFGSGSTCGRHCSFLHTHTLSPPVRLAKTWRARCDDEMR